MIKARWTWCGVFIGGPALQPEATRDAADTVADALCQYCAKTDPIDQSGLAVRARADSPSC